LPYLANYRENGYQTTYRPQRRCRPVGGRRI
jgi:hypothetical protein